MSIPPEYILAKMKADKSREQVKPPTASSRKRYYTPSRDRNAPAPPMIGTPMAVPAEYVSAKLQAERSLAACTTSAANTSKAPSGKRYYTPSRDRNTPAPPMIGTPMVVPAEYISAKLQAEKSLAARTTSAAKSSEVPSGKGYCTPSRDRNTPAPPMIGTPTAVPAAYVLANMKAETSHAHRSTASTRSEGQTSTQPSTPRESTTASARSEGRASTQPRTSRESTATLGTSGYRSSGETTYSYDKLAGAVGRLSLRRKIRECLH